MQLLITIGSKKLLIVLGPAATAILILILNVVTVTLRVEITFIFFSIRPRILIYLMDLSIKVNVLRIVGIIEIHLFLYFLSL